MASAVVMSFPRSFCTALSVFSCCCSDKMSSRAKLRQLMPSLQLMQIVLSSPLKGWKLSFSFKVMIAWVSLTGSARDQQSPKALRNSSRTFSPPRVFLWA